MTTDPDTPAMPRCLDPALPYWGQPRTRNGLVAVVAPAASTAWADEVLAGDGGGTLVWSEAGLQPERTGLHTLHRVNVRAVSLAPAGRELQRVWAAIQFAWRLGAPTPDTMRPNTTMRRARLTSVDRPATVDRSVRLPHLTTVRYVTGTVTDMVVWELMPRAAAPQWSRISPADEAFVEANVHRLLTLRAAARDRRLPATEAARRLADALRGRPLTIRTVYGRLDLVRPVLDEIGEPVRRRARRTREEPATHAEMSDAEGDIR